MSARSHILGNIQGALGRGPLEESSKAEIRHRMSEDRQGVRPAICDDLTERFIEKIESVSGTVDRVAGITEVPGAIQNYLLSRDLGSKLVVSNDQILGNISWPARLELAQRPAEGGDRVSVTGAFCGIAETGTLVLRSGPDSPTTLNFLPDDHIVVLQSLQIVTHIEDAWQLIKKEGAGLPRTINLVTGPSRTADVEQTIQLGAHGPRRLHVVLIDQN